MSDFWTESGRILGGDGKKGKNRGGKGYVGSKGGKSGTQGPRVKGSRPQQGSTNKTHGDRPRQGHKKGL